MEIGKRGAAALGVLTVLLVFALVAFYLVHLFKTPFVENDMKAFWAVVIFMGSIFSMPIYWRLYVWNPLRRPTEDQASSAAAD